MLLMNILAAAAAEPVSGSRSWFDNQMERVHVPAEQRSTFVRQFLNTMYWDAEGRYALPTQAQLVQIREAENIEALREVLGRQAEIMRLKYKKADELKKAKEDMPAASSGPLGVDHYQAAHALLDAKVRRMKAPLQDNELERQELEILNEEALEQRLAVGEGLPESVSRLVDQYIDRWWVYGDDDPAHPLTAYNRVIMRYFGKRIITHKAKENPQYIIIAFHGLANRPEFFVNFSGEHHNGGRVRCFADEILPDGMRENTMFIIPEAPMPSYIMGLRYGSQWTRIGSISQPPLEILRSDLREVITGYLLPLVKLVKRQYRGARIIPWGFSQGAIVVLELLRYLTNDEVQYAIAISGACDSDQITDAQRENLRGKQIFVAHHRGDAVVRETGYFRRQERAAESLRGWGATVEDFTDGPLEHELDDPTIRHVKEWLQRLP